MLRTSSSHLRILTSTSRFFSQPSTAKPERQSVEEMTQKLLATPPSRLPGAVVRVANTLRFKLGRDNVDGGLKNLLDKASAQLYFHCANNYDFQRLCEAFGLPDYMSSWYKLTLMHVWILLLGLHTKLDGEAYMRLQRGLLSSMWLDVDQRLQIISKELNQVLTSATDMRHMHGLHVQTFLEYDEGFLKDDRTLAGAVWRCLYMQRDVDPIHVLRVVHYIRSTVSWLETVDCAEILASGVPQWRQVVTAELNDDSTRT